MSENRLIRITILDPESSDPTWGLTADSIVIGVWSEDLALVESGELRLQDAYSRPVD